MDVLQKIATEFNRDNLLWAIGASLLLYFKGVVRGLESHNCFHAEIYVLKPLRCALFYIIIISKLRQDVCDNKGER